MVSCQVTKPIIRVVEAAAAAERLAAARAFLASFPPATEILIIGASREAADDLAREVTASRGGSFGLHRLSFLQLAVRFAAGEMASRGRVPMTALGMEALAARVTFDATREDALPYFEPVARFPGFAPAVAATLSELRRVRAEPPAMARAGGAAGEIAELLLRFEREIAGSGLADRAELLTLAAGAAAAGRLESWRRMPMLLLDVAIDTPVEHEFVRAVTAVSPAVLITVPAGDEPTRAALAALAAEPSGAGIPDARVPSELDRVRAYLFADAPPPEAEPAGDVVFFSAPGEDREAMEIARFILDEARASTPFDRMAVLLRTPTTYGSLLEAALARADIPAFFARGTRRPDPAGRAFVALLDCAREGLSARRFAEYLSLGQVPPIDRSGSPASDRTTWVVADDEVLGAAARLVAAEDAPTEREPAAGEWSGGAIPSAADDRGDRGPDRDDAPVVEGQLRTPWRWEALLVESAVIGGRDRWVRRLDGLEAEYRLRLDGVREQEPDSPQVQALEREILNLGHLRQFALPVIDRLAAFPGAATWGEWLPILEGFAPMVLRRPERVLAVLAELRPLAPIGPVLLDEVRDVLRDRLTSLEQPPADSRYGRVFVGAIEQARGRAFDVVFLPGLAERVFPQRPREDPLLLDDTRRRLELGLSLQHDRARQERWLLRLAAGAAVRRLYLSYSRIDLAVARARVPSFYALEVRRAIVGQIPSPQTLESAAERAAGARLAWPAPEDPSRALDQEEHDLATLGELLRSPAGEGSGRARYLLDLNPCLARSLRARYARWVLHGWMPSDGIVRLTESTRESLAGSSLRARSYSASALQRFAACPYQFYLAAICRLEPRQEITPMERLDPATRGKIFHRVQAETMRALERAGMLPLETERLTAAIEVLDRTFARVSQEYHEELAPAIERVWQGEMESMRVDLRVWLERSAEIQATWAPIGFELAFGLAPGPEFDPQSTTDEVTVDGFRLRGIVDLIERQRGGPALRVTDYKTGRNYTAAGLVVGGGETLQPVIYGLAMERVLGQPVVESRLFFCTREGGFSERVVRLDEPARRRGVQVLATIEEAVAQGFLPPAPRPPKSSRPSACEICDFLEVCGRWEVRRSERKDARALRGLAELRELR
jgi:ATP-dependent helicase/nuclease subunit B